ncbi:ABC transporter ATP-binding protein [bacterium]|nr:ABC transporter ATP-binding protein [bacterium]
MFLKVQNLNIAFNINENEDFQAVKDLSFDLEQGEILGIIGESGSGKSVATQAMTGLIADAITTGSAEIDTSGTTLDLLNCSEAQLLNLRRNDIAYIFQEPMTALNPILRCGEQIGESIPEGLSKADQKRQVFNLLERVELLETERIFNSFPHELSGGQRQRIMIAMALAKNPSLLIADEPTTALDVAVQGEIQNLLKTLAKEENIAIIFITHDLLSLANFADRILVMYKGEQVETGTTSEILKYPNHSYTKALIASRANYRKRGKVLHEVQDFLLGRVFTDQRIEKVVIDQPKILLELKEVNKWHDKKSLFKKDRTHVLKDINLSLYEGDSLGLIGESGSGKSTIAKIILKLWSENRGEVLIKGQNIHSVDHLAEQIQLVFQDPYSSLNPKHKIKNAIAEVIESRGETARKSDIADLLETVGLKSSDMDKYPHEFSGGQRQRICIAKALAKSPEILVLDEAVSALDVSVQARILNLLNKLKVSHKLTYLLISHDMNVVAYFCNKIAVLKDGKILEYGPTEQLIDYPQTSYTQSLLEHSIN